MEIPSDLNVYGFNKQCIPFSFVYGRDSLHFKVCLEQTTHILTTPSFWPELSAKGEVSPPLLLLKEAGTGKSTRTLKMPLHYFFPFKE